MFTWTTTYTDYNGTERTEKFYFNFSQAELMEMELTTEGGLKEKLEKIVKAKDRTLLASYFKQIILDSYGEKTDDGRRFVKSKELSEAFSQTEAYSNLYMELVTNTDKAVAFINGVMPKVNNPVPAPATK